MHGMCGIDAVRLAINYQSLTPDHAPPSQVDGLQHLALEQTRRFARSIAVLLVSGAAVASVFWPGFRVNFHHKEVEHRGLG